MQGLTGLLNSPPSMPYKTGLTSPNVYVISEITERKEMQLSDVQKKFILHWGEVGAWSGINRSVAQIFALLYLSPKPLNAEQISQSLSLARSNVSTGLRELQGWRLIRCVHVIGDRRDHFETLKDVWEMFTVMMEERRRREFDPTRQVLQSCIDQLSASGSEDPHTARAIRQMLDFFETMTHFHEQMRSVSPAQLRQLVQSVRKAQALLKILPGSRK